MPYIENWSEFSQAVETLYLENPIKCRLVIKYRHKDGVLVVKCTDNAACVMYKTEDSQDIKRIEKLSSQMMRHMAKNDN